MLNKKIILSLAALILAFFVHVSRVSANTDKIYVIGDSMVVKLGESGAFTMDSSWQVVFNGAGGTCTDVTQGEMQAVINQGDAKYVVIWSGLNDVLKYNPDLPISPQYQCGYAGGGKISASAIEANLQSMYNMAHNAGIKVVAVGLSPVKNNTFNYTWTQEMQDILDGVNGWIASSSADYKVGVYAPLGNTQQLNPAYDLGDHLHLNSAGNAVVANLLENNVSWSHSSNPSPTPNPNPTPATPSLSADQDNVTAPSDVNFTLTNGANCINYECAAGERASIYDYEHAFRCHYDTAGSYVASITCGGNKIKRTISVTAPTPISTPTAPACSVKFTESKTSSAVAKVATVGETKGLWLAISNLDTNSYAAYYACESNASSTLQEMIGLTNQVDTGYDWRFNKEGKEKCYLVFFPKGIAPSVDWSNAVSSCKTDYVTVTAIPVSSLTPTCSASFFQTSLTAPGTSYLTFNSSGADKLFGSCTGPLPIPQGDYGLAYSNYPFSFSIAQTGTETCTFTPYNGTTKGTDCKATVTVTKAPVNSISTCGNDKKEENEKCDIVNGVDSCVDFGMTCNKSSCECERLTPALTPALTPTSTYESVYQLSQDLFYCSADTGGAYGQYPCTTNYLHHKINKGFKDQWNPYDPMHRCQQAPGTTCSEKDLEKYGKGVIAYGLNLLAQSHNLPGGNLWRYYLPKGTTAAELVLYGIPSDGEGATLARFGSPPTSTFPASFDQFNDLANYSGIFPPTQYPDVRSFWSGKTIEQLKQHDWFAINQGGHITVLVDSGAPLTEGNWLYINFKSYDGSGITQHAFSWYADEKIYTDWYDCMNAKNGWDDYGDPKDNFTSCDLPTPPTGPNCAAETCKGVDCDSKNGTSNPWIKGMKIEGCAIGTAKADPNSFASPGSSFITWSSTNASKMDVACTGAVPLKRDVWYTSDEECRKAGKYCKTGKGYELVLDERFFVSDKSEEICTFYPTNKSDNLSGTPFSVTLKVETNAICGNNIVENQEECDYAPSSGQISYVPCPANKTCKNCKCVADTETKCGNNVLDTGEDCDGVNHPCAGTGKTCQNCKCISAPAGSAAVCTPDNPNCAAQTCKDIVCFDGCKRQQGTKNCSGL